MLLARFFGGMGRLILIHFIRYNYGQCSFSSSNYFSHNLLCYQSSNRGKRMAIEHFGCGNADLNDIAGHPHYTLSVFRYAFCSGVILKLSQAFRMVLL